MIKGHCTFIFFLLKILKITIIIIFDLIMWSKQLKDKIIRLHFSKKEVKVVPFYFLISSHAFDPVYKVYLSRKVQTFNKKFYKTQIKNRCVLSLRSRSPLSDFRLSRVAFRSLASGGNLLGVKKSSW